MKKLWYSLAFTLLGSSVTFAQGVAEEIETTVVENQNLVAETPVLPTKNSDESQTIFFVDDSLAEEIEAEQATLAETSKDLVPVVPRETEQGKISSSDNQEGLALLPADVIEEDEADAAEIAAQAKAEADEIAATKAKTATESGNPQPLIPVLDEKPIIPIENGTSNPAKSEEPVAELSKFDPSRLLKVNEQELPLPTESQITPEQPKEVMQDTPKEIISSEELPIETQALPETVSTPSKEVAIEEKETIMETSTVKEDVISEVKTIEDPVSEPTSGKVETETVPEAETITQPQEKVAPVIKEPKPVILPQLHNQKKPSGPFALDENAPINSNIMGDSGFAPSLLNKKIGISPEQRAKMLMKKKYDEMDVNKDGVISEEEFIKYKTEEARKISKEIFARVDKNGNKTLSVYEYEILMNKMIESYIKAPKAN